jgi:hypothetical protein
MNTFWFLLVAIAFLVLIFVIWVRNSASPFADSLRAMFKSKEKEAADAVDSVQNRVNSGLLKKDDLISLARTGLYNVKIILAEREQAVSKWQKELDLARSDKDLAHQHDNREAFAAACRNYDHAVTMLTSATTARDQINTLISQMETQVDAQRDEKDAMEEEGAQLAAAAVIDDTNAKVNEAQAGLTKADGGRSDFAKAHQLADKLHARSSAASGAAGGLTQHEREVNALKALRTTVNKTNVDDEWNRVGERLAGESKSAQ